MLANLQVVISSVVLLLGVASASAQSAPPTSPHPRIILTPPLLDAWRAAAKRPGSTVAKMIATCDDIIANPKEYDHDVYMHFTWASAIQNCATAYVVTSKAAYATAAVRYFAAILDDLADVGDGKGGDRAVQRDSGYPIRAMAPYTALAYDWLYASKAMTPALKAKAHTRWQAWLTWYRASGYHARDAASNYQAGYLLGATLIAIAQDEGDRVTWWRHVVDDLWGKDMAAVLAPGGFMDGGDWPEGWQYAPLSIAEYALAGRALTAHGVATPGLARYFEQVLQRHVAAMTASGKVFANGDTDVETPNIEPAMLTLASVAISDASPVYRQMARAELAKRDLHYADFVMYEALALDGDMPAAPASTLRGTNATWLWAPGTSTLYARTRWDQAAVWTAMKCSGIGTVDHMNADAGNVVLSRGVDDVLPDPSPYGTLSTLTSNAPTAVSAVLPKDYPPGQGFWATDTRFHWAHQANNGVVLARCDYADQFRFREVASDVPVARRDLILLPSNQGKDANLVVFDQAASGTAARPLMLRFRVQGPLTLNGNRASYKTGKSHTDLVVVHSTPAVAPKKVASTLKDCWGPTVTRGNCDASRFPVEDFRLTLPGPTMQALQVVATHGGAAPAITHLTGAGIKNGVVVGDDVALWGDGNTATITYRAPRPAARASHVIADGPAEATVTATLVGNQCELTVAGSAAAAATPTLALVDQSCAVVVDNSKRPMIGAGLGAAPANAAAGPDQEPNVGAPPTAAAGPRSKSGCCQTSDADGDSRRVGSLGLGLLVLLAARRRRQH